MVNNFLNSWENGDNGKRPSATCADKRTMEIEEVIISNTEYRISNAKVPISLFLLHYSAFDIRYPLLSIIHFVNFPYTC
jgi:hypothetical protein